jgi:Sec-independent protein translocase protein TatA
MIDLILQNYLSIAIVLVLVLIILGRIDTAKLAKQIEDVHSHLREYIRRYDKQVTTLFCDVALLKTKNKEGSE